MPLTPAAPILNPRLLDHFKRRFNCDFIIQHRTNADDGQGGTTPDWTIGPIEWLGAIHALSNNERLALGAATETTTHELSGGYQPAIDVTMRVLYGTRIFDIQGIDDPGEQHLLTLLLVQERFRK